MVLFYASWCPYSRMFLPVFEKAAESNEESYARILVDDHQDLANAYEVAVYPTVLFFENGKLSQRLDGTAGIGLKDGQLRTFAVLCRM